MKFTVDKTDNYVYIKLNEENFNSQLAPSFKSEAFLLKEEGYRNMIFDFSDVKYVDSSGLSAILTANRFCEESNGRLVLTGIVHPNVKSLISISRLDDIFVILPTIDESVEYILMEEVERDLNADIDVEDKEEDE